MPTDSNHPLPIPEKTRWQPLRSGLINLFLYDNEEFRFTNGRLLLRGNNGTGKSRFLALQLPFLLDGDIKSSRVEPDGDSAKRMEWHLLMDRHPYRMGYSWIEFGRLREDGEPEYCTLGCGMEASKGSQLKRWHFVTPQRVGEDLELIRGSGAPVPRDGLSALLEGKGTLYQKVSDYRRAVDDRLFHLGETRYLALVNLLIQLRKPQLSRDLDEAKLSKALSDSLPPLDSSTISDVAEAFRELERDREQLDSYKRCVAAVRQFDQAYRGYAKVAVGRNADRLRSAHNAYENKQKATRKAETTLAETQEKLTLAQKKADETHLALEATEAEQQTLQESNAMQSAQELDRSEAEAQAAVDRSTQATQDQEHALADIQARQVALTRASEKVAEETKNAQRLARDVERSAQGVGISVDLKDQIQAPGEVDSCRVRMLSDLKQSRENVRHLEKHLARVNDLVRKHEIAEHNRNEAEGRLSNARDDEAEKQRMHQAASCQLVDGALQWHTASCVLCVDDIDAIVDRLRAWCESLEGKNPLREAVDAVRTGTLTHLGHLENRITSKKDELENERAHLLEERTKLESGEELVPPAPHTRDESLRQNRPGVPLWQACDFRETVPESDRAGYEAALEAAGILDAWITPQGSVLDPQGDTLIQPLDNAPVVEPSLCDILRPAINSAHAQHRTVANDTVDAVLSRIGIGDPVGKGVVVRPDGSWCHGILHGKWSKSEAGYIGAGARQAKRERRLAEIAVALAGIDKKITVLAREKSDLAKQRAQADREWDALPSDESLRQSMANWNAATELVSKATTEHGLACQEAHRLKEAHAKARDEYMKEASELNLAQWADRLEEYKDALQFYSECLSSFWPTLSLLSHATLMQAESGEELEAAKQRSEETARRLADAKADAARKTREYETLRENAGAEIQGVKDKLGRVRKRLAALKAERQTRQKALNVLTEALGEEKGNHAHLQNQLTEAEEDRSRHMEAFRVFASTGMLEELGEAPEGIADWSPTRLVEYVRDIFARIGAKQLSDDAWDARRNALHAEFQKLQSELSARNLRAESQVQHNVDVVLVDYNGKRERPRNLLALLEIQIHDRQQLLSAKERDFIENHLIAEVAEHLHSLICQAAELVANMNMELTERPTSTGMRLRFRWEPIKEGPPGTDEACALLRRKRSTWSEDDQKTLAGFLHARITEIRESSEGGTWRENLEEAVDYRRWHQFDVERNQNNQWKKLTKRTHGTGSGGEKALALTIPQFAAAAAHYHTVPDAPRLIMLDEVFAGIDRDMRDKCMGLLETFDLDFVMTSESEWGCYPSISGLSICQLATQPGIDAVAVTPWQWNGKERIRKDAFFHGTAGGAEYLAQEELFP